MFEPFAKVRVDTMRELVNKCYPRDKVICDIGSGSPVISDTIISKKIIKVDVDDTYKPDVVCDITKGFPFDENSIDICIAGEIIEHIYESRKFLKEISRVLRNNGFLILSCPNICSLKNRIQFLLGEIPPFAAKADCTYEKDWPGHIRDYNFKDMVKLLNQNFKVLDKKSDGVNFRNKTILPNWILPITLGDSIIIRAQVIK